MSSGFGYSYLRLYDGERDTLEELRVILHGKRVCFTPSDDNLDYLDLEDETAGERFCSELIGLVDWYIDAALGYEVDNGVDLLECPHSDWHGKPFVLLITGGMIYGDLATDAQEKMHRLYYSILPVTVSEEIVLWYRVRKARGLLSQ